MTLSDQLGEIGERIERTGVLLKEALSIIDVTFDDQISRLDAASPYEAFNGLSRLIDHTVHGATIERFRPRDGNRPFHTFEILTEQGEVLGYLNMLHLSRPIPCYYLVYVEVMPGFRGLGLGNRILTEFMGFLEDERAVGLLDNIIPPDEPSYEIYIRLGWRTLADQLGCGVSDEFASYMVFVPKSAEPLDWKARLMDVLVSLEKRRPVIDMHDNDDMVRRTIDEFRTTYRSLEQLFRTELASGASPPLMRFMFTRLATKLLGFQRRISTLIGYTGGESLQQLSFSNDILNLPIQPYSIWDLEREDAGVWGDNELLRDLPGDLRQEPTIFIEALPLYRRPYLQGWMNGRDVCPTGPLSIRDLFSCGFDPTRLREFHHNGTDYIFERISPLFFSALLKKRTLLRKIEKVVSGARFRSAIARVNPILLIFRDRGNTYVLRRQLEGIHSQEALDQLAGVPGLRALTRAVALDRLIANTIEEVSRALKKEFGSAFRREIDELSYFVPWDIEQNFPKVTVDVSGVSLGVIWIS